MHLCIISETRQTMCKVQEKNISQLHPITRKSLMPLSAVCVSLASVVFGRETPLNRCLCLFGTRTHPSPPLGTTQSKSSPEDEQDIGQKIAGLYHTCLRSITARQGKVGD